MEVKNKGKDKIAFILEDKVHNFGRARFLCGGRKYPATLVNIPTLLETYKTYNNCLYYKSGDVGQMLVVHDSEKKKMRMDDNGFIYSGVLPPFKGVKRKWRKPFRDRTEVAEAEAELLNWRGDPNALVSEEVVRTLYLRLHQNLFQLLNLVNLEKNKLKKDLLKECEPKNPKEKDSNHLTVPTSTTPISIPSTSPSTPHTPLFIPPIHINLSHHNTTNTVTVNNNNNNNNTTTTTSTPIQPPTTFNTPTSEPLREAVITSEGNKHNSPSSF